MESHEGWLRKHIRRCLICGTPNCIDYVEKEKAEDYLEYEMHCGRCGEKWFLVTQRKNRDA